MPPPHQPPVTAPADAPAVAPAVAPAITLADALAGLLLAAAAVIVAVTFGDHGITVDEWVNHTYGRLMLDFWRSGGVDTRAFAYLDLRYYGPWFQTLVAAAAEVSPWSAFTTRHLLGGVLAWLTLFLAWRIGRAAAGPAGGLLTLVLLTSAGYFVGNAFNNPIDLPFAFAAALYLKALIGYGEARRPGGQGKGRPAWRAAAVGLALGLAVATRAGGGVLALALPALMALLLAAARPADRPAAVARLAGDGLIAYAAAALVGYALWPFLWPDPAGRLIEALTRFNSMPMDYVFPMFGHPLRTTALPAWYLPANLAVRLPLLFVAGILAAALVLPLAAHAGRRQRLGGAPADERLALFACALVALLPIAVAILGRTTLYDGFRHFLFVLVPLAALAAAAVVAIGRRWRRARPLLIAVVIAELALMLPLLVALHPYQYIYFNTLVGGPAGAVGRFEMEYAFATIDELMAGLVARLTAEAGTEVLQRPIRVGFCLVGREIEEVLPPAWVMINKPDAADPPDFVVRFDRNLCPWTDAYPAYVTVSRLGLPLGVVRDLRRPAAAGGRP